MATLHYTAKVEPNGLLSLPKEAYEALQLKPGDLVDVTFGTEALETIAALQEAYDDVEHGRTLPAHQALEELRQKHGIPR